MSREFQEYLLKKGALRPHHVPYYLKWVADCYAFLGVLDSIFINSDHKNRFLVHMAKDHEERQVKQADVALSIYAQFLTPQDSEKRPNRIQPQ